MAFTVIGVHPIVAPEPCYLFEVEVSNSENFDWGTVTQEAIGKPRGEWQAVWNERPIDSGANRWVFFFHYLDLDKPLVTPMGPVGFPSPTPLPDRLSEIRYELPG